MNKAQDFVFIGTSFSVKITSIVLRTVLAKDATIKVVDPNPIDLGYQNIKYCKMTARDYFSKRSLENGANKKLSCFLKSSIGFIGLCTAMYGTFVLSCFKELTDFLLLQIVKILQYLRSIHNRTRL